MEVFMDKNKLFNSMNYINRRMGRAGKANKE